MSSTYLFHFKSNQVWKIVYFTLIPMIALTILFNALYNLNYFGLSNFSVIESLFISFYAVESAILIFAIIKFYKIALSDKPFWKTSFFVIIWLLGMTIVFLTINNLPIYIHLFIIPTPILVVALFVELAFLIISASFYLRTNYKSLWENVIMIGFVVFIYLIYFIPTDSLGNPTPWISGLWALITTTAILVVRLLWYCYEKWSVEGLSDIGRIFVFMLFGINAYFQFGNLIFSTEIYRNWLSTGLLTEIIWSVRFALYPIAIIYPILYWWGNKQTISEDVEELNKRNWVVFNFIASFSFVIVLIVFETVILPLLMKYDTLHFNGAVQGMLYRSEIYAGQQSTNYFSYVFYVLLQSPAPALMIGFMIFGAIAVMVSQNIGGMGKVIGGFATGIIVIIPMVFIFSILTGGIPAPELLSRILDSGVAQFVFALAEISAFILVVAIIAVFISAGKVLGNIMGNE